MKQPFEAFHYCTRESYAVVDTGCQRSAVGKRTLEHIISRLPSGLNVKFDNQKFRFSGIGGETVASQVALIPVAFGQRPGMVRAAVLEDTPDAPFLLSLPILKELHTSVHLSEQNMHFQSINETAMRLAACSTMREDNSVCDFLISIKFSLARQNLRTDGLPRKS
jgi:hypothetical protein